MPTIHFHGVTIKADSINDARRIILSAQETRNVSLISVSWPNGNIRTLSRAGASWEVR